MIIDKKCDGKSKAFGFEGCKTLTNVGYLKYGLCQKCYPKFILTTEAGKEIMSKAILKVQKPRIEMETATIEHKAKTSLKAAHINTRMQVHAFVRERDKGKPCICCDAEWDASFHASHFFKAETFITLKYSLDNIHSGCQKCNLFLDGNHENYALRLPNRIGKEKYDFLVRLAEIDKQQTKFWTLEKLKDVRDNVKLLTNKSK